ncbi:DDE-type integrase/transposase/recombinase [Streptomyces virginiae]|uniref:DDE-type integrase/transposase/recombinase n=1 Tax=Streptomyces virginiae TaxID=1961 RepID=UPI00364E8D18
MNAPAGSTTHAASRSGRQAGRHRRRLHRTTTPDPHASTRPDPVLRDFQPDQSAIDTRWCGDITYIATDEGRLHLATVIDIASRRVVGWATTDHLRTELVADALAAACRSRRPVGPVIFHSDRGYQYISHSWQRSSTSGCPSAAPVSAGTTPSRSRSSPP